MNIRTTASAIAVSLAITVGCEQTSSADSAKTASAAPSLPGQASSERAEQTLVSVNGQQITADMFGQYYRERMQKQPGAKNNAQSQNQALNELINILLLAGDAGKKGLDSNREVQTALALQRAQLLSRVALTQYAKDHMPTDDAMKAVYEERQAGAAEAKEYHARHILVKTEGEAKELISQINAGADFAELAKENSTGPTGKNGGDLGWFDSGQMVKPFSDAVAAMEKGGVSQKPVETQFGWHVIKLEDERSKEAPSFEAVRQSLQVEAQRKSLSEYVQRLTKEADIEVNEAFTKPDMSAPAAASDG